MIFEYANRAALLPTKCGLLIFKRINEKKNGRKLEFPLKQTSMKVYVIKIKEMFYIYV